MSYCGLFVLWCLDVVKFAEIAIGIILCGSNKFDLMFIGLVLKYSFVYVFEECDVLIFDLFNYSYWLSVDWVKSRVNYLI